MKKFLMLGLVVGAFSLMGADYASAATGCRCNAGVAAAQPAAPVPATAQAPQGRRSYSVEPAPMYRAPMTYRRVPARVPAYLLPKTDPRKYSGF